MSEKSTSKGLTFGLSAYLIWGSFPLIISALAFAGPWEIVVWRIVFGFLTAAVIIAFRKDFKQLIVIMKNWKQFRWVITAAVLVMVNWQIYVIAIVDHHVIEASLGYFINPLVTIGLAVVFLKERLSKLQWAAVAFGFIAVVVLTFDYGRLPWLALSLAFSFAVYGLAKSKLGGQVSAVNSFALEAGLLLPVAIIQLWFVAITPAGITFLSQGFWGAAGLSFYGVMTAVPLILFGLAAQHLPLRYIGFMQYLTPSIQFVLALTVFHEPMPQVRWIGFGLVWVALVLLSTDLIRQKQRNGVITPA
ncbi:MAG: EamA family transporter RarD [Rhodoluna sp.]|nr:EamA family transporter RarD [Rhodoluna sp.]